MDKSIEAATNWLCNSDIRNKDAQKPSFGGINNAYFYKDQRYEYVYNEITGYAINTFLTIHKWLDDDRYLQYAKDAADYLIRQQAKKEGAFENHAVPHSLIHPDLKRVDNYYSFDNAIILHGMVNLFKLTGEKTYRDACLELGNWLLAMQKKVGAFYSHYEAEDGIINHPYDEFWFDGGCLHVKNAIGLMLLNDLTGDGRYLAAGLNICDRCENLLAGDGLFWVNPRKKYVFTHAHCYATEGYLYAYHLTGKSTYLDIARKAGRVLIRLQNTDGSLYRTYKTKLFMKRWIGNRYQMSFKRWRGERRHPWKTIDATAQAARIWLLLFSIENKAEYLSAADKAIQFIKNNQELDTKDQNMFGGFYYQLCDTVENAEPTISQGMYAWCTQFGLSALLMANAVREKKAFNHIIEMLY